MTYQIGNYEVFKNVELGRGSYSIVYKGKGPTGIQSGPCSTPLCSSGTVAIKKINKNKMTEKALHLLEEEIAIMKLIKDNPHENIVKCYQIIDDIDTIYFVLEYCDSGDLRTILKKPIKEKYAKFYFSQIVNGLKYLDDNDIMHRDIKPSNILLTGESQTIKICDFGFAKRRRTMTKVNTICGSPLYMAPEIFESKNYGFSTDIWSIGIILYEMLFGFHPFDKCKDIEELTQSLSSTVLTIPPKENTNPISDECIVFLRRLLEKNINERIEWAEIFVHPWINLTIFTNAEIHLQQNASFNQSSFKEQNCKINKNDKDDKIEKVSSKDGSLENSKTDICEEQPFFAIDL